MSSKRGNNEGSIYQRHNGTWCVRVNLGRDETGKRRRKSIYTATQAEAVTALKRHAGAALSGDLATTSTPSVGVYLEEWSATNRDEWKPKTQECYRLAIDRHLTPAFGHLRLEQLTPRVIQRWLTQHKEAHGARRRITLAHAVLRSALSAAERLQLVSKNAATSVVVSQPTKKPTVLLDVDQAAAFLTVATTHRLAALFTVAIACGLRMGEACGLRWTDVDLETGEVRIRQQVQRVKGKGLIIQTLKTEKSRRTLSIPAVCLQALRLHRTRQLEERLKAGAAWVDSRLVFVTCASDPTVSTAAEAWGVAKSTAARWLAARPDGRFTAERQAADRERKRALRVGLPVRQRENRHVAGGPLDPQNVLRIEQALLETAGLPKTTFHALRHSAASLLLAAGVPLVDVSQLLGHSEIRLTADLYAHLQKETARKAARVMDRLLGGGR